MEFNDMSYEKAVERLKTIIKDLESEELTLNDALDKFKTGIELYRYCNDTLNKMDGEIKAILEDGEEKLLDEEF